MKKSFMILGALLLMPVIIVAIAAGQESRGRINVTLMSCEELQCVNRKDIFLLNESAYLDYNSTVNEISYSATLTFPDGTEYQTNFPNRITSNVTGDYMVEMIVWKEGYEETHLSKVVRFVDSLSGPSGQEAQNPPRFEVIPILVFAVPVVLVFVLWRYSKRKSRNKKKPKC